MTASLRDEFLLDPEVTYLNHGSFGACPRVVFDAYQRWQRKLEWNPSDFIHHTPDYMLQARSDLGAYLHTDANNLIFFQNPTVAANMIMRSLDLKPGDEILTSNYEYGAMNNAWAFYCERTGAKYIHQEFPMPVHDPQEFVDALFAGVTERTKVIFFSHVTSPTAMIYPAEEICRRARELGLLTFVDGAHAPAQIPVDLDALGCDFYVAACHKWMCAPKGSAFAYAAPARHAMLVPIVISPGWNGCGFNPLPEGKSALVHYQEYQGTRDVSAFLAVTDAIRYMEAQDWESQRQRCHALALETRRRICALTGMEPFSPPTWDFIGQFVAVPLPAGDLASLSARLTARRIVVPVFPLAQVGYNCIRVSYQAYNDERDMETLLEVLQAEYAR
ncbi:MAG: aminotransferase class V-fold PLP-dependent enzyme [Anaerolineae bacterium]|nr:aminotransferase class V-fold PLP-dependent enzyme [Anaerolineae bacterium]